jgi:hypothetical protein
MLKRTYDGQVCSVVWILELLGERWISSSSATRDALLGHQPL